MAQRNPEVSRGHWARYLAGYRTTASVPGIDRAGRAHGWDLVEHVFELDLSTTAALAECAAHLGVTLNSLIQCIWGVLLARYNDCDDVVFGTVVSGRPADLAGVEDIVGLFLQAMPVRVRPVAGRPFSQLAREVQTEALAAMPHHHFALAEMQAFPGIARPLLDHVLVFENYPLESGAAANGFEISNVRGFEQMHYDFSLVVHPRESLEVKYTFNANVIARGQVARMEGHFRAAAAAVLRDPEAPVDALRHRRRTEHTSGRT